MPPPVTSPGLALLVIPADTVTAAVATNASGATSTSSENPSKSFAALLDVELQNAKNTAQPIDSKDVNSIKSRLIADAVTVLSQDASAAAASAIAATLSAPPPADAGSIQISMLLDQDALVAVSAGNSLPLGGDGAPAVGGTSPGYTPAGHGAGIVLPGASIEASDQVTVAVSHAPTVSAGDTAESAPIGTGATSAGLALGLAGTAPGQAASSADTAEPGKSSIAPGHTGSTPGQQRKSNTIEPPAIPSRSTDPVPRGDRLTPPAPHTAADAAGGASAVHARSTTVVAEPTPVARSGADADANADADATANPPLRAAQLTIPAGARPASQQVPSSETAAGARLVSPQQNGHPVHLGQEVAGVTRSVVTPATDAAHGTRAIPGNALDARSALDASAAPAGGTQAANIAAIETQRNALRGGIPGAVPGNGVVAAEAVDRRAADKPVSLPRLTGTERAADRILTATERGAPRVRWAIAGTAPSMQPEARNTQPVIPPAALGAAAAQHSAAGTSARDATPVTAVPDGESDTPATNSTKPDAVLHRARPDASAAQASFALEGGVPGANASPVAVGASQHARAQAAHQDKGLAPVLPGPTPLTPATGADAPIVAAMQSDSVAPGTAANHETQPLAPIDNGAAVGGASHASAHAPARAEAAHSTSTPLPPALQAFVASVGPGLGNDLGQRILWLAGTHFRAAEIQLDPPDLGPLQVHVQTHRDGASVQFVTHTAAARDAVESSLPRLREMLEASGMNLLDVNVAQHHERGGRGAMHERGGTQGASGGKGARELEQLGAAATSRGRPAQGLVDDYA